MFTFSLKHKQILTKRFLDLLLLLKLTFHKSLLRTPRFEKTNVSESTKRLKSVFSTMFLVLIKKTQLNIKNSKFFMKKKINFNIKNLLFLLY